MGPSEPITNNLTGSEMFCECQKKHDKRKTVNEENVNLTTQPTTLRWYETLVVSRGDDADTDSERMRTPLNSESDPLFFQNTS